MGLRGRQPHHDEACEGKPPANSLRQSRANVPVDTNWCVLPVRCSWTLRAGMRLIENIRESTKLHGSHAEAGERGPA